MQSMCESVREERVVNWNATSTSAPNRLRVLQTLRQLPEFASAFQCSADSEMQSGSHICHAWWMTTSKSARCGRERKPKPVPRVALSDWKTQIASSRRRAQVVGGDVLGSRIGLGRLQVPLLHPSFHTVISKGEGTNHSFLVFRGLDLVVPARFVPKCTECTRTVNVLLLFLFFWRGCRRWASTIHHTRGGGFDESFVVLFHNVQYIFFRWVIRNWFHSWTKVIVLICMLPLYVRKRCTYEALSLKLCQCRHRFSCSR